MIKSTSPTIPIGSLALVGLAPDQASGGYTVRLLRVGTNGHILQVTSSAVVAAPDLLNKMQEKVRGNGQPQDAVSGNHVFLPERMIIRFTLASLGSGPANAELNQPHQQARPQQEPSKTQEPKGWIIAKIPEIGSSGQDVMQSSVLLQVSPS